MRISLNFLSIKIVKNKNLVMKNILSVLFFFGSLSLVSAQENLPSEGLKPIQKANKPL
jgi:hypothetical protein